MLRCAVGELGDRPSDEWKKAHEGEWAGWVGRLTQAMRKQKMEQSTDPTEGPPHSVQHGSEEQQQTWTGSGEKAQGLTSLGMKDDPSVTRDQKAMPPHMRYFRLYLSPR